MASGSAPGWVELARARRGCSPGWRRVEGDQRSPEFALTLPPAPKQCH